MSQEERKSEMEMVREALDQPKDEQRIEVVGRVVEGKIELDQKGMEEFARKYPDARMTFVAVNAPFDPERSPASLGS